MPAMSEDEGQPAPAAARRRYARLAGNLASRPAGVPGHGRRDWRAVTSLTTPAGIIRGDDGAWYATTPGASDDLRIGQPPLVWLDELGDKMAVIEFEDGSLAAKPAKGEPWDEPPPPGCMAAHFARRINNALRLRHSSPRLAILAYLRRIATDDGLVAASHATIAQQAGVARGSVPFLMDEMVALGHLAIVRRGTSAGQPTCYRIAD